MKQAFYSQEGVVEFGCDCVRLSVPTHPDSGVRLEQTGAVLSAPPGALSAVSSTQSSGLKNHPNSLHLPFVPHVLRWREASVRTHRIQYHHLKIDSCSWWILSLFFCWCPFSDTVFSCFTFAVLSSCFWATKKVCLPLSKAHYYLQIQQTSAAIVGKNAIILKPQN